MSTLIDTILDLQSDKADRQEKKLDRAHDMATIILSHELGTEKLELQNDMIEAREDKKLALDLYDKKMTQLNTSIENINQNYSGLGEEFKTNSGYQALNDILDNGKYSLDKLTNALQSINKQEVDLQKYSEQLEEGFSKVPAMFSAYKDKYAGPEGILNYDEFEVMLSEMLGEAEANKAVDDPLAFLDISGGKGLRKHYYGKVAPDIQRQLEYEQTKARELASPFQVTAQSNYMDIQAMLIKPDDKSEEEHMASLGIKPSKKKTYEELLKLFKKGQGATIGAGTTQGKYGYDLMLSELNDPDIYSDYNRNEINKVLASSEALGRSWKQLTESHGDAVNMLGKVSSFQQGTKSALQTGTITSTFSADLSKLNLGTTTSDKDSAFQLLQNTIMNSNLSPVTHKSSIDDLLTTVGTAFNLDLDTVSKEFNQYLNPTSSIPHVKTAQKYIDLDDISGSADAIWDALSTSGDFTTDPDFAEDIYAEGNVSKKIPGWLAPTKAVTPISWLTGRKGALPLPGTELGQDLPQERPGYNLARAFGGGLRGVDSPFYQELYNAAQTEYNNLVDQIDPWGWDQTYKMFWSEGQKFEMLENYYMEQDPSGVMWNEVLDGLYTKAEIKGKEAIEGIVTKGSGEKYQDLIKYLDLIDERNK
tara:strand:+ start:356 stop:2296 length:1941 start_codon:yes stop_codon:yes gene_type:complete